MLSLSGVTLAEWYSQLSVPATPSLISSMSLLVPLKSEDSLPPGRFAASLANESPSPLSSGTARGVEYGAVMPKALSQSSSRRLTGGLPPPMLWVGLPSIWNGVGSSCTACAGGGMRSAVPVRATVMAMVMAVLIHADPSQMDFRLFISWVPAKWRLGSPYF